MASSQDTVAAANEERSSALGRGAALWLALCAMACRVLQVQAFPIYDDAFITFRYARHLAAGDGMVFNPGAPWEPVLGTTTPLYAALLALPALLGFSIPLAALAINVACDGVTAYLLARLGAARPLATSFAVLAFAALPVIGRISVGGMEAPLFALLCVKALHALRNERPALAGLCAGLACTTRPEGVLVLAVLAMFELRTLARARRFLLPVAVVGIAAFTILRSYYGDPIPQSVQAKASTHGLGWEFSRALLVLERGLWPSPEMWLGLPLVVAGLVLALRHSLRSVVIVGFGMLAAYTAAGAKTWGWYFYLPLLAWCVAFGEGADAALSVALRGRAAALRMQVGRAAVICAALLALAGSLGLALVQRDRVTDSVYSAMDGWCKEQDTLGRQPTILATDIGAIGWYSGTRILDSEALVWPAARAYERQVDALRAELPDYALVVVNRARMLPFREDPVAARYEPVARFSTYGLTRDAVELEPRLDLLVDGWKPDYILYRRKPAGD
ncbi:MAG: DUF2029 domain-containing protein [Planctomycetes bacterium]|nr:DUF2029 domain-containing protein [Planctomycetota bacterium]